jgi:7-cyano-7-deazaguanine synthase
LGRSDESEQDLHWSSRGRFIGYPDCRPEFYEAFQQAVNVGTKPETNIEIRTPVIGMKKFEIVRRGIELSAPLN